VQRQRSTIVAECTGRSHGEDVRALHIATHTTLSDSLSGIVGHAGDELTALSQRWQKAGTRHVANIDLLVALSAMGRDSTTPISRSLRG